MDQRSEKLLEILKRDFYKKPKKEKNILDDVESMIKELEKEQLSESEITMLNACYDAEYNDSVGSLSTIAEIFSIVISVINVLVTLFNVILTGDAKAGQSA